MSRIVLLLLALAPALCAAGAVLPNADFEEVQAPGDGKYACPFSQWMFIARSGDYAIEGENAKAGDRAAIIRCTGDEGRADLMSKGMEIAPFTEVTVRLRVRQEGATTALVALHPPLDRTLVDLALIELPERGWARFETRLRSGSAAAPYRITIALVGAGSLAVDDLEVEVGQPGTRPAGRVLILDLNPREDDYEPSEDWWIKDDIEDIWGYEVVVLNMFDLEASSLAEIDPVAVILSPLASRNPPHADPLEKKRARKTTLQVLDRLRRPTLGICLGHQYLGMSVGTPMRKEAEKGVVEIERLARDPIFAGLPATYPCDESHRYALERVPEGYVQLARSPTCEVQAIRRRNLPVYGFQGHFERGWTHLTPHGRVLLGNFFDLVEAMRR